MSYNINLSGEEITERLNKADTAVQPVDLETAETALEAQIGDLTTLETTAKTSAVAAINELFQSVSDGKTAVAAAITDMGIDTAAADSFDTMAANIRSITTGITPLVINDSSITPTGSYATSTYYNVDYGVKIGYMSNGDILLSMQGGTTTAYENLNFTLASAPTEVTLLSSSSSWSSSNPAGQLYVCVISGITTPVNIAISMSSYNATYDYATCAITVTEAAA